MDFLTTRFNQVARYFAMRILELKSLALEERNIILASSADLSEKLKLKRKMPTYTPHSNVCAIAARYEHLNVYFCGAELHDTGLVEGNGQTMRHLSLMVDQEIDMESFKDFFKQAIVMGAQ